MRRTLFALSILGASPLAAQVSDTLEWMRRPEIREIRAIVGEMQRQLDAKQIRVVDSTVNCGSEILNTEYGIGRDGQGRIRTLRLLGGSEDHGEVTTYYYDRQGRLRFAFGTVSAVNGSTVERRAYWRVDRSLIVADQRIVKGEGYPVDDLAPIFDPASAIEMTCREPG